MIVRVNGEHVETGDNATIESLLAELDYGDGCVVVAINEVFVPRPFYATKGISENDRIEILGPMQGG